MDTILSLHDYDPGNVKTEYEEFQEEVHPYPHEINTTEGSEFLDDAIRMKDQPLEEATAKENE